jgi:hypothetical protein
MIPVAKSGDKITSHQLNWEIRINKRVAVGDAVLNRLGLGRAA